MWCLSLQVSTSNDRSTAALLAACLAQREMRPLLEDSKRRGNRPPAVCSFYQCLTVSHIQALRITTKLVLSSSSNFLIVNIIRQPSKIIFAQTHVCQLVYLLLSPTPPTLPNLILRICKNNGRRNEIGLDKREREWDKQKTPKHDFL